MRKPFTLEAFALKVNELISRTVQDTSRENHGQGWISRETRLSAPRAATFRVA